MDADSQNLSLVIHARNTSKADSAHRNTTNDSQNTTINKERIPEVGEAECGKPFCIDRV